MEVTPVSKKPPTKPVTDRLAQRGRGLEDKTYNMEACGPDQAHGLEAKAGVVRQLGSGTP